ncbi:MAG: hypothetical protein JO191_00685 [Mycobacteriaceae bacterium]|nr:hypothetical protein [Mycobacteriaceae bacterium]MBV9513558.1 hypothetical protein [Mycobacteriaceae bacterium]
MGDRLARRRARQHPNLTGSSDTGGPRGWSVDSVLRGVVLGLLGADGVISAVLGALLLQIRLGAVPFPISALISGLINAALVWAGLQWTSSLRLAALALWTWLLTVAVMTLTGPGGDLLFGGPGLDQWSPVVLLVLGVLPPGIVLWRATRARRGLG